MAKLKLKRDGFSFSLYLEGEVEINEKKIKSYEEYHREQTDRLIKEEVVKYLSTIIKLPVYPSLVYSHYDYKEKIHKENAIDELAEFLIRDIHA
jgi:hypothetical protein